MPVSEVCNGAMFSRKLQALEYPALKDFNENDEKSLRSLVVWLEDKKIRHYKVEHRQALRQLESDDWNDAFVQYVSDVGSPVAGGERLAATDWLLGLAVRLEYESNAAEYDKFTAKFIEDKRTSTETKMANPLDNINFEDPEFQKGIEELVEILKIPPHPDRLVQLEAVCKVILDKLSAKKVEELNASGDSKEPVYLDIDKFDAGLDVGDGKDYVLGRAAKVLRLLHLRELRALQSAINECIVQVQALTANPRTEGRLGKVGLGKVGR